MATLLAFNSWINGIVWGTPFMILLVGTGLYLSVRLGFFQFTHLLYAWRRTFGQMFRKAEQEGAITSFQAVTAAMAATIGVGNIAGVATAIALGGPGAALGLWGVWEVFIDTIVVCTMTALVILVTGVYQTGETGGALTSAAFSTGLPGPGGYIVIISIVLFSYATMLTWNFYGEKSWEYLFGQGVVTPYRILFLAFLFIGAIGGLEAVWEVADTLNGLMAAPNLIALILLAGVIVREKVVYLSGQDEAESPSKRGQRSEEGK